MHLPKDPLVQVFDKIGTISVRSLQDSFEIVQGQRLVGFLLGRMKETRPTKGYNGTKPDLVLADDTIIGFITAAKAYIEEETTPKVRTPLTKENLLEWAKKHVKKNPTQNVDTVDRKGLHKTIKIKNTPARVLAEIALAHSMRSFEEYRHSELVEVVRDFCWDGTKGYKTMTADELLEDLNQELIDPNSSNYEFDDLEDLLANFDLLEE